MRHLLRLRIAVAGRAALQHIGDKDITVARQAQRAKHVVEQLAGLADERLTLQVFVLARGLAHEHPFSAAVTHAEDRVGAGVAQAAGGALGHGGFQRGPVHGGDGGVPGQSGLILHGGLRRQGFDHHGARRRGRGGHRYFDFDFGHSYRGDLDLGFNLYGRLGQAARHPFRRDTEHFEELRAAIHADSLPSCQARRSTSASSRPLAVAG
ncbi:hypothetical protein D3C81_1535230 [compost metagenome]